MITSSLSHKHGHTMTNTTERESPWVELLTHAERLLHLVENSPPKAEFPITPPGYIHMVSMFWRARRLYDGVLILLKAQFPEEAAILARKLFEVSLYSSSLKLSRRTGTIGFGWVNRSINEEFGLLNTCIPNQALTRRSLP